MKYPACIAVISALSFASTSFAALAPVTPTTPSVSASAAATLFEHVNGYTLNTTGLSRFTGLVTAHGKVLAIGDAADLHARYPQARVVDGVGKTLLPGLIDAHGHVLDLGFQGVQIDVTGMATLDQTLTTVAAYAKAHSGRAWLQGGGWNQVPWGIGRFPTARELDTVTDRPTVLSRIDGHAK